MNEAQASEIDEQLEMLSLHHEELRRDRAWDTSEELFVKSPRRQGTSATPSYLLHLWAFGAGGPLQCALGR